MCAALCSKGVVLCCCDVTLAWVTLRCFVDISGSWGSPPFVPSPVHIPQNTKNLPRSYTTLRTRQGQLNYYIPTLKSTTSTQPQPWAPLYHAYVSPPPVSQNHTTTTNNINRSRASSAPLETASWLLLMPSLPESRLSSTPLSPSSPSSSAA
jgi:hypothetical protein